MSSRATIVQRVVAQVHALLPDVRITRVRSPWSSAGCSGPRRWRCPGSRHCPGMSISGPTGRGASADQITRPPASSQRYPVGVASNPDRRTA